MCSIYIYTFYNRLDVLATWLKRRLASHPNLGADYAAEREYYLLFDESKISCRGQKKGHGPHALLWEDSDRWMEGSSFWDSVKPLAYPPRLSLGGGFCPSIWEIHTHSGDITAHMIHTYTCTHHECVLNAF